MDKEAGAVLQHIQESGQLLLAAACVLTFIDSCVPMSAPEGSSTDSSDQPFAELLIINLRAIRAIFPTPIKIFAIEEQGNTHDRPPSRSPDGSQSPIWYTQKFRAREERFSSPVGLSFTGPTLGFCPSSTRRSRIFYEGNRCLRLSVEGLNSVDIWGPRASRLCLVRRASLVEIRSPVMRIQM